MRRTLDSLLVLSVLLASASPAFGQSFGQITAGCPTPAGRPTGATITVPNPQTGVRLPSRPTRRAVLLPNLAGLYHAIELQGFQRYVATASSCRPTDRPHGFSPPSARCGDG